MTYQPNYTDPRVKKRIERAVDFATTWLTPDKDRFLHRDTINRFMGRSNDNLGRLLRNQLLKTEDAWWNHTTGKCKTYSLRVQGVLDLTGEPYTPKTRLIRAQRTVAQEFPEIVTGAFEYKESDNRLYHPAQNLPTDIRQLVFANTGYSWNYDIACSMPTLVLQYARKLGLTKDTPYLDYYTQYRTTVRQELANHLGCTLKQIKISIAAKFVGARLSPGGRISTELDRLQMYKLRNNSWFVNFCKDQKIVWDYIKVNRFGLTRLTPTNKMSTYRYLERSVMKQVERYLRDDNNQYFLEHDGWRCRDRIDVVNLSGVVRRATGYSIQIDEEQVL